MSQKTEVILFDLGGVLLPFDREQRVRAVAEAVGVDASAARGFLNSEPITDFFLRLDRGLADEADFAQALTAFAGQDIGPIEARALILSVFEEPNTALWRLVARLRGRAIVGGLSDNPSFVRQVFPKGADLDPMFWSCDLGLSKPSPEVFEIVTAQLRVPTSSILFIDDTLANVEQAQRMGWDAIQFTAINLLFADLGARGLVG